MNLYQDFLTGKTTPTIYLENCIETISQRESIVQAFVHLNIEEARTLAEQATQRYSDGKPLSPLDGIPVGIKDIIDTLGMPTQMNSPLFQNNYSKSDAAVVQAIRKGGGIPFGKTVTTEFAIGQSGPTTNPHDQTCTPGGSSSGSAAGVAANFFPVALGTQTQGSIIRPASFCGAVGYKPTHDRISPHGVHSIAASLDHVGVLANSVSLAWGLTRWMSELAPGLSGKGLEGKLVDLQAKKPNRVAILRTQEFSAMSKEALMAFEQQVELIEKNGVEVLDTNNTTWLQELCKEFDKLPDISLRLLAYEMRWPYSSYVQQSADQLGDRINKVVIESEEINRQEYYNILEYRVTVLNRIKELCSDIDAFILPASTGPAPQGFNYTGSRNLLVYATFLGLPAYSLPVMTVANLPMGLQLIGHKDDDFNLTTYALWCSRIQSI